MIDISKQILTTEWLSLPHETKVKMVVLFDIPRSGTTSVEDNIVVDDGYDNEDLESITQEKLEEFTKKTGTFRELLALTINIIEHGEQTEERTEDKGANSKGDGEHTKSPKVSKARKGKSVPVSAK